MKEIRVGRESLLMVSAVEDTEVESAGVRGGSSPNGATQTVGSAVNGSEEKPPSSASLSLTVTVSLGEASSR